LSASLKLGGGGYTVQAVLVPYGDILTRFQSLMAPVAAKRGPGRQCWAVPPVVR